MLRRSVEPTAKSRHSRNGCYGTVDRVTASVRLDVEGPDHLAPLLGFLGDHLAEVSGRTRKHRAAEVSEMGLHLRVVESRVNFLVDLVNDLRRCVLGRADAIPLARLVAPHERAHGRYVWQHLRPYCGGHSQRTQLACPDVFNLSLSIIFAGVPIGATMPAQNVACRIANPLSVVVGTLGNEALRISSATASTFSFPALICGRNSATVSKVDLRLPCAQICHRRGDTLIGNVHDVGAGYELNRHRTWYPSTEKPGSRSTSRGNKSRDIRVSLSSSPSRAARRAACSARTASVF